jgi:hypothetical protein
VRAGLHLTPVNGSAGARAEAPSTSEDPVVDVFVDDEIGREGSGFRSTTLT